MEGFNFGSSMLDELWVCENEIKDFDLVKIPKCLKEDVKMKKLLTSITKENEKNVLKELEGMSYSQSYQKIKYLANNIAYFGRLLLTQRKFLFSLARDLKNSDEYGEDFRKALLGECFAESSGRFLRYLLDAGIYTKDEVWERLKSNMSFHMCFFLVTGLDMQMQGTIFEKCPPNNSGRKLEEDDTRIINDALKHGFTKNSLGYFIMNDDLDGVKKIIESPDYDKKKTMPCPYGIETEMARNPIDFACFFKARKCVDYLLEKLPKQVTSTAAMNAAVCGDLEILKKINATGKVELNASHFGLALKYHRWETATWILQNFDCKRQIGMGLDQMINWRNPLAVVYGIQTGRPVNEAKKKEPALSTACRVGEENLAFALIDMGASATWVPNYYPHSPLTLACQFGHSDLAKALIKRGADPTTVLLGRTALTAACEYGFDTELVEFLIKKECDVNQEEYSSDPRGYEKTKRNYDCHREFHFPTPLCYAARSGCLETVKLILKYKPALVGSLPNGETLMTWAVRSGNVEIVRILDESGASLTQKSNPPLLSIPSSNDQMYRYLFDHGANDRMAADETFPLYKMPYTFERRLMKGDATEGQLKAFTYANQAATALKLRNVQDAAKMINAALKEDNKCVDAYRASALMLLKLKDCRLSEMMSRAALSIAENDDQKERCLLVLAKCARANADFKTEIDALSEAYRMGNRMAGQKLLVAYSASIGRGRNGEEGQETPESLEALIKQMRAPEAANDLKLAKCVLGFVKDKKVYLPAELRYVESCLGDTRGERGHSGPDMALSYFPEIVSTLRPGMKFGLAAHDFSKKNILLRTHETIFGKRLEYRESDAAYEAGDAKKQEEIANKFLETARAVLGKAKFLEAINNLLCAIETFTRAGKEIPFPVYSNLATAAAQAQFWPLARIASVLTLSVKKDHAKTYEKLPKIAAEMGAKEAEEKLKALADDVKKGGDFNEFSKRAISLLSIKSFTKNEDGDAIAETKTPVVVGPLSWKQ